jgi:hypothetical protein
MYHHLCTQKGLDFRNQRLSALGVNLVEVGVDKDWYLCYNLQTYEHFLFMVLSIELRPRRISASQLGFGISSLVAELIFGKHVDSGVGATVLQSSEQNET